MTNAADDLATHLAAAGLSLTKGTNLFVSHPRDASNQIPKNAVFITGSSGPSPQRVMGRSLEIRWPTIQVRVRWSTFSGGDTKARAIFDNLRNASISGYLDVAAINSEPDPVLQDDVGLHYWGMFFSMPYIEGP